MGSLITILFLMLTLLGCIHTGWVTTPCERIYLQPPNDVAFPYNFLQGVYDRLPGLLDGFYRYKMPGESLYFQYSRQNNLLYFATDNTTAGYIGLQANLYYDASNFNVNITFHDKEPFTNIILVWRFNVAPKKFESYSARILKFICVSKDVFKCQVQPASLQLQLLLSTTNPDGSSAFVNNPATDSYNLLPGVISTDRPVYRSSRMTSYLFYVSKFWIIGPDYKQASGFLRNTDNALLPEFIRRPWQSSKAGVWKDLSADVRLRCKGFNGTDCNNGSCGNGGQCFTTSYNESFCQCDSRYTGKTCNRLYSDCGALTTSFGESLVAVGQHSPNSLSTIFCSNGYEPKFIKAQCVSVSGTTNFYYWKRNGTCSKIIPTTPRPRRTTTRVWTRRRYITRRRYSYSNTKRAASWVLPVVLSVAIVLQLTLPCMHWVCTDIGLCRVLSMDFFISLLLWSIYLIICSATDCYSYYPSLFDTLKITAIVIICFAYLIILLESCFSNENEYLSSLMQCECIQDFIDGIRAAEPSITLSVCCWHYETRTKVVYYTDANGNQQSRIETYQERVDTYHESEGFTFLSWRDISAATIPDLNPEGVTRLKVIQDVEFGDAETTQCFTEKKNDLIERNRHRDVNIDFGLDVNIPGFKERLMGYVDAKHIPWWLNKTCYWLLTLIGLTWPYRLYMKYATGKAQYTIHKEVFSSRQPWNDGIYNANIDFNQTMIGTSDKEMAASNIALMETPSAPMDFGPPPSYEHAVSSNPCPPR